MENKSNEDIRHCWMPISKSASGGFVGILSDNSIDRDEEFMTKELLQSWAEDTNPLPMLANHENKIEKLVGGWTEKRLVTNGDKSALVAKPFFLKSNPLGRQTEEVVEEALSKGMNIGISIGAIPRKTISKEIDGKSHTGFSEAEIVEATIVPIQSNRNASFTSIAKSFNFETKEQTEVSKMTEEIIKKEEPVAEAVPEPVVEEAPVKEEVKEEVKEKVDGQAEVEAAKKVNTEIANLQKELADLKEKAVMNAAPTVEPEVVEKVKEALTLSKMADMAFGGKK